MVLESETTQRCGIADRGCRVRIPACGFRFFCLTTKTEMIMKEKFFAWMRRNNMTFSAIAGETFTNAEVVYTHIGLVAFLIVMGLAGSL